MQRVRDRIEDALWAALPAAVLSGIPSTTWALAMGRDPLEAARAAGNLLLPATASPASLLIAGAVAHVLISIGWALVLSLLLPRRRSVLVATLAGAAIAVLDLAIIGRLFPLIAALDFAPQLADHVAYGAIAGAVIARRRAARSGGSAGGGAGGTGGTAGVAGSSSGSGGAGGTGRGSGGTVGSSAGGSVRMLQPARERALRPRRAPGPVTTTLAAAAAWPTIALARRPSRSPRCCSPRLGCGAERRAPGADRLYFAARRV
jgi:hypothetical protein